MPYDHAEVARQIQETLEQAQRHTSLRADATVQAVDLYEDTAHSEWVERVSETQTKRWVAVPESPLHEFTSVPPASEDYTVVATDSSFIPPDKHRGSYCYMINVGRVMLQYGSVDSAADLSTSATHCVDPLVEGDDWMVSGRLLQAECAVQELEQLRDWAVRYRADVALLDGSLMQLGLALSPTPEVQELLREYYQLLNDFRTLKIPVAGYVSRPASHMVMHGERILACDDAKAGRIANPCERRCSNAACTGLWTLDDGRLFDNMLQFGQRSPYFRTYSAPAARSNDGFWDALGLCYLATRHEIARLEFPLWVAEDGLLDRIQAVILRQCELGDSYPLALTLAHNYAVLRNDDRESYFYLLERAGLIEPPSEKALGKRMTGNRI